MTRWVAPPDPPRGPEMSAEEWLTANPPSHQRAVASVNLHEHGSLLPTNGPDACAHLVPELRPQVYYRNGLIPDHELRRLNGVLRTRRALGLPLFVGTERRFIPPRDQSCPDAPGACRCYVNADTVRIEKAKEGAS